MAQNQVYCCETPPVLTPETINVPNCDGTTSPVAFDDKLDRVVMVQDKPLVVCLAGGTVDFEIGCSSVDGRTIVLVSKAENGVYTQILVETDAAATPVTDGSTLVKCGKDFETSETCFQLISDPDVKFTRVTIINTETKAIEGTIWIDVSGASIAAPVGVEPCGIKRAKNGGIEYWLRLDSITPTLDITSGDVGGELYNSLTINNLQSYIDSGDFRPFRGQDPTNNTVVWVEVEFFNPTTNSNYNVWYAVPSGTKIIQMEDASIVSVPRVAVADNIDADLTGSGNKINVKGFQNGLAPSTPINLLFTFNLSV